MCDSLLGPLSNSAQPSVVCNPILSASLDTESWAVSHGCTSIALVRPSRKKNLQTMVPSRFMAAISTEEGGSLRGAAWARWLLSRHHWMYCRLRPGTDICSCRKLTKYCNKMYLGVRSGIKRPEMSLYLVKCFAGRKSHHH